MDSDDVERKVNRMDLNGSERVFKIKGFYLSSCYRSTLWGVYIVESTMQSLRSKFEQPNSDEFYNNKNFFLLESIQIGGLRRCSGSIAADLLIRTSKASATLCNTEFHLNRTLPRNWAKIVFNKAASLCRTDSAATDSVSC